MDKKKEEKNKKSKDIEKDKEEDKVSIKEIKKKQNKQIMWAIILMASLILIIILVPFIFKTFVNKFVYINLDWQKTKLGDIIFYSTKIPLTDNNGQIINYYTMNFRKNPRELEYIKVDIPNNTVTFQKGKEVYIALDPDMTDCEGDNTIALINLAGFLRDVGGLNIKSAVTEKNYSKANGLAYVTCLTNPYNTVMTIKSGNETSITKVEENCYYLTYSDCEIISVTEKFMIIILEDYMGYFLRK